MDYQNYIVSEFNMNYNPTRVQPVITAFLDNNETVDIAVQGGSAQQLNFELHANNVAKWAVNNNRTLYGYLIRPASSNYQIICTTTQADYFFINAYSYLEGYARLSTGGANYSQCYDYANIGMYLSDQYMDYFSNLSYQEYVFDCSPLKGMVYDFTSIRLEDNTTYSTDYSYSVYQHVVYITNDDDVNMNYHIGFGSFSYAIRQAGYTAGESAGYVRGERDGYENGYQQGLAAGSVQGEPATAFTYLTSAFGVIGSIMEIEVLPHITIGTCFSIPLVIVLIMTIFKLVKK